MILFYFIQTYFSWYQSVKPQAHVGPEKDSIPACAIAAKIYPLALKNPCFSLNPGLTAILCALVQLGRAISGHTQPLFAQSSSTAHNSGVHFVTLLWNLWQQILITVTVSPR